MKYLVALDPQLGLSSDEFADAWNASEHAAEVTASVDKSAPAAFLAMEITVALITAAVSIPTTIITDFVVEVLKKKYVDKDKPKVSVTTISTPDGQPLLVVKKQEV